MTEPVVISPPIRANRANWMRAIAGELTDAGARPDTARR
jgi:hypothetical protein